MNTSNENGKIRRDTVGVSSDDGGRLTCTGNFIAPAAAGNDVACVRH